MALELEIRCRRSGKYASQVRQLLVEVVEHNPLLNEKSIYDAKRIFDDELRNFKRMSVGSPCDFYKSTEINQKQFTIHHLNAMGDADRVFAILKQVN